MSIENNFKKPDSGMDRWGKQRLALAVLLRDKVLPKINVPWVIENGTLLGAYRTGKFIQHDDDFDIALFFEKDPSASVQNILNTIKDLLPAPYHARYVSSYCKKIEVYDPTYGSFVLPGPKYNGATFHYVTADLQFYQRFNNVYRWLYFIQPNVVEITPETLFPLGSIALESEEFPAPFDVKTYLKCVYGSLSPKAKFNPTTGLYEVKEEKKDDEWMQHAKAIKNKA